MSKALTKLLSLGLEVNRIQEKQSNLLDKIAPRVPLSLAKADKSDQVKFYTHLSTAYRVQLGHMRCNVGRLKDRINE